MNVHGVNDAIQTEVHAAESTVPQPSVFEFELTIEELKHHRSHGIHQIQSELIKAGSRTIHCEIHKHNFFFAIRRNCLRSGRI
jgi:hypothetical protein